MNKICCVEDADVCPSTSSCSMVLRSACSHRHSRESSTASQRSLSGTPRRRKQHSSLSKGDSCSGTSHLSSSLKSSLKEFALKSANSTYSILKQHFYNNYELSENINQKVYEVNAFNVSCARELNFSHLSTSNNSAVNSSADHSSVNYSANHNSLNSSVSRRERSSDYSSADENDIYSSDLMGSTSNMSRTRLTRSTLSSLRSLSGSEGEDDISIQKNIKVRRGKSDINANHGFAADAYLSEATSNSHYISSNHNSISEKQSDVNSQSSKHTGSSESNGRSLATESSQLDMSNVQYSSFDRFRWFLWRCSYLKIIKNVNFDVWCLSRLHSYKKHWVVFLLLLPLLLYIIWGLPWHNTYAPEEFTHTSNVALSSINTSILSVFTWLYNILASIFSVLFREQKEELVIPKGTYDENEKCSSKMFSLVSSLTGSLNFLPQWFTGDSESVSASRESKYQSTGIPAYQYHLSQEEIQSLKPSREEIRLWATEVLRDEINMLKELHRYESQGAHIEKVEKELKLQKEMKNLNMEFKSLSGTIQKLERDILKQTEKSETVHKEHIIAVSNNYKKDIDLLSLKLKTIETKLGVLEGLKNCCDKQWSEKDLLALLEKNLMVAFKNIVDGDSEPNARYYFFNQWLNSKFFSQEKLMQEINAALKKQSAYQEPGMDHDYVVKVVESTVLKYVETVKKNLTDINSSNYVSFGQDIFSEDKIKKIVKEAIMLYDADKTGQVDYALESGGGSVLSTRCSETYVEKYGKFSILGVPLWTNSNSPRTAIQPDMQPGRCWAFKGSQGFLVIELSATIYPTGFTLEHIPVSLSPSGSIDSAPKNFSVWGLESDKDNNGKLLGEYSYAINGEPLQYFPAQKLSEKPYSYVELQIHSNHGNLEYTCLYRFRVHGRRFQ